MPLPEPNAKVESVTRLCDSLIVLRVTPTGWDIPDFEPGQYAMLGLPYQSPDGAEPARLVSRSYSVASPPSNKRYFEFLITLVQEGALSPQLFALKAGDDIWMARNLAGFFTLKHVAKGSNVLLLATGSGLSACIGLLRSSSDSLTLRRIALVHGARTSIELAHRDELERLAASNPNFSYFNCISRPEMEQTPWKGRVGYIQDVLLSSAIEQAWGFELAPENTHIFVSGNPAMCDEVSQIARNRGFTEQTYKKPGTLHLEKFW